MNKRFITAILAGFWFAFSATFAASPTSPSSAPPGQLKNATAIFAGGCFWCMEADYEKLPGVTDVVSGYIGGHVLNPTYKQVSAGTTGHYEAVLITYDPSRVTYEQLLEYFWSQIDPTVDDRQFCDVGTQYRSAIFYLNEVQRAAAEASKSTLENSGRLRHVESKGYPTGGRVLTNIIPATNFYTAEQYHQDYYKKNPVRYRIYRTQCGRDARLKHIWGTTRP